jgi:hypothetical protein
VSVAPSPLRRLTHNELDNTLRDLLGVTGSVTGELAPDEQVGPFYSNVVAPVSELVADQCRRLAERLASEAVSRAHTMVPCEVSVVGEQVCAEQFIDAFGARAHRRPLTDAQRETYRQLYTTGRGLGGHRFGVELVVSAMLQSPHFLYPVDHDGPLVVSDETVRLDGFALASRLSFFLWRSMPDDALLEAARDGLTDEELREQAQRLLIDPRAADAIGALHVEWLGLEEFDHLDRSSADYPDFGALKEAMREETRAFADHVVRRGDGRLETLLTAPWSIVDGPLFDVYGIEPPADHEPGAPVQLNSDERAGLLTQPSVLALHAHDNQSSPIKRGIFVRENLLCQPLSAPPPDVDLNVPPPDPSLSTRDRFAEHTSNQTCQACHAMIDPIGFGFEHYDQFGAYRRTDGGRPVDAAG